MSSPFARIRFALDHRWSPPHMSDHLDGDLDARRAARLERHVGECPECRELLLGLEAVVAALGGVRHDGGELVAARTLDGFRALLRDSP
jgi:anti-sigma factor RsiW